MTRRIAFVIEYDGTGLCGWQRQDNGPTVQGHIEGAISEVLGEATSVVGASRTDAGVHAEGQVCHFETRHTIPADGLAKAVTSLTPPSIAVREARDVSLDFHARFSSIGKLYRYRVLNRDAPSPLLRHRAWHVRAPLNLERMREASEWIVGEHDFSAFRASGCSAKTTVREVREVRVTAPGEVLEISVRGNAFLRNMVRIIAGTLVSVGRGKLTPRNVGEIIESKDRVEAGQTAPAQGLSLIHVFYDSFM